MRESLERLRAVWITFQENWKNCHDLWQDGVAARFEREFIEPWHSIEALMEAMADLEEDLRRAEAHINSL